MIRLYLTLNINSAWNPVPVRAGRSLLSLSVPCAFFMEGAGMSKARKRNKEKAAHIALNENIEILENLKNANEEGFKETVSAALQFSVEGICSLSAKIDAMKEVLTKRFQQENLISEKQLEHRDSVENMRFYLLHETTRVDLMWNRLKKMNIISSLDDDNFFDRMLDDTHVTLMGYDCTGAELKERVRQTYKAASKNKNREDEKYQAMRRDYERIKNDYPDAILFFCFGDFYEIYFDDANTASRVLKVSLINKEGFKDKKIPMCRIPRATLRSHFITELVRNGYGVAICESDGGNQKPIKHVIGIGEE